MQRAVIWTSTAAVHNLEDLRHQGSLGHAWAISQGSPVVMTLRAEDMGDKPMWLPEFLREASARGIPAYQQLVDLVVLKAFDVLWIESFHRLSRATGPLGSWVELMATRGVSVYVHDIRAWITPDNWAEEMSLHTMRAMAITEEFLKGHRDE